MMQPIDQTEMPVERTLRAEIRAMVRLAFPVVVVQVGMMGMGVVDTIMVGHVSPAALAAVALGNLYVITVTVFGMGVLMALDPIVSQAFGAGDEEAIALGVQRGFVIALVLGVIASLMLAPGELLFRLARQPEDVVPVAARYALVSIPGTFPFFAFIVLRQTLQAMKKMAPVVWTRVVANAVNAFLNWVLIFGNLGVPAMGAVGSGWASTIGRWFMALMLLVVGWNASRRFLLPIRHGVLNPGPLKRMLALGVPIGGQFQLEFGAFGVRVRVLRLVLERLLAHQSPPILAQSR